MKKSEQINGILQFAKKLNLNFKNIKVLENAFVHRSYLNENPSFELQSNERLEFLGDAVLELVITEYLFRKFQKNEGELTALRSALVRGKNLSEIAQHLGVSDYLYLSAGEKIGSEKSKSLIYANCLEAIIGAIYLDQGLTAAKKFVEKYITVTIKKIIHERLYLDPKSEFQEKVQEKFKITPIYKVIQESGPDHNKEFISGVFIDKNMVASGYGSSKNLAEQDAAQRALDELFNQ